MLAHLYLSKYSMNFVDICVDSIMVPMVKVKSSIQITCHLKIKAIWNLAGHSVYDRYDNVFGIVFGSHCTVPYHTAVINQRHVSVWRRCLAACWWSGVKELRTLELTSGKRGESSVIVHAPVEAVSSISNAPASTSGTRLLWYALPPATWCLRCLLMYIGMLSCIR